MSAQQERPPIKKAVLVGCAYPGSKHSLNGCLNDIQCMAHCLKTRFGFPEQNVILLRDDVNHPDFISTRANIFRSCQWLMTDLRPGDRLVFHFSGHGSQQRDRTGMEKDGFDETILPTDFQVAGQITDTELNAVLVRPLPAGVVLHAIFDSCHSGTMLDLPLETDFDKAGNPRWKQSMPASMGTAGGLAIQIGACDESQTAADTAKMSQTAYTGAATFTFIEAVEHFGPEKLTYALLLRHMVEKLASLGKTSIEKPSSGRVAMQAAAPLALGLALGPLALVAGAVAVGPIGQGKLKHQRPALCCNTTLDLNTQVQL